MSSLVEAEEELNLQGEYSKKFDTLVQLRPHLVNEGLSSSSETPVRWFQMCNFNKGCNQSKLDPSNDNRQLQMTPKATRKASWECGLTKDQNRRKFQEFSFRGRVMADQDADEGVCAFFKAKKGPGANLRKRVGKPIFASTKKAARREEGSSADVPGTWESTRSAVRMDQMRLAPSSSEMAQSRTSNAGIGRAQERHRDCQS